MVSIRGRGSSDVESGDADDNHATEDQEATGSRGGEQAATLSLAELGDWLVRKAQVRPPGWLGHHWDYDWLPPER